MAPLSISASMFVKSARSERVQRLAGEIGETYVAALLTTTHSSPMATLEPGDELLLARAVRFDAIVVPVGGRRVDPGYSAEHRFRERRDQGLRRGARAR